MEHILEELNEGVGIADDQLRLIFANEALLQVAQYDREEIRRCSPDALFPAEDS
jgi:PAS domain-containing protein